MPFAKEVKEAALVASARHCCVCRRYAGVMIEVHHILPQDKGGDASFDNAIPLCFDCHAAAGHYNAEHPRGTRYSPGELRRHREEWYRIVQGGALRGARDPGLIYARHLICRTSSVITELCAGNLGQIPVPNPRLWENEVTQFVRATHRNRSIRTLVGQHESAEAVRRAHPDIEVPANMRHGVEVALSLTEMEARHFLGATDSLTCSLLAEGVPVEEVAARYLFYNECGVDAWYTFIDTRPLWLAIVAVENASQEPVVIDGLTVERDTGPGMRYRMLGAGGAEGAMRLPPVPLEPGGNVLIPEAVILAPFGDGGFVAEYEIGRDLEHGYVDTLGYGRFVRHPSLPFSLVGPALYVKALEVDATGGRHVCPIHALDPSNVYVMDRHWYIGSCPHLFCYSGISGWTYEGAVLGGEPGTPSSLELRLPRGCELVRIWELEYETTIIESLRLDGDEQLTGPCRLSRGEWVEVPCWGATCLEVSGFYTSRMRASALRDPYQRTLVQDALAGVRSSVGARAW